MFNPISAILNVFHPEPGDFLPPEPEDFIEYYETLLLGQFLEWGHDGSIKPGHIEAVVLSPYANDGLLYALWYSDVDHALDYIPVEDAWLVVTA